MELSEDISPVLAGEAGQTDSLRLSETHDLGSRTVVGAGWMVAWRMVTRTLGFASTLILARLLVPADFGLVAMASAFSASIDALSQLGLLAALVRRPDTGRTLYDTAFTLQAIRGLATGCVIAASAVWASAWFGEPRLLPILAILAGLATLSGFENIGIVEFQKSLRFDKEFGLLCVPRIVQFAATSALAFEWRSYWALVAGIAVGKVGRLAMTYVAHSYRPRLTLARWRELVGFSFWTWASSMAGMVWERCDPFVLGPVLGVATLGVYLLAGEIGLLPTSELVAPAASALYAGISAAQNRGKPPVEMALPVMAALMIVVVPVALGFSATSGYIVAALLGPKWAAGRSILAIFSLVSILTPITFVCTTVLNAAGFLRQNFYAVAGAAAFRVAAIALVASTRRMDWIAAVVCGVVSGEALMFLLQLRGRGNIRWHESIGSFGRTAAAAAVVVTAFYCSGFGWSRIVEPALTALVEGGSLGMAGIAVFMAVQFGLWAAVGRPQGAEVHVLGQAARLLRRPPREYLIAG